MSARKKRKKRREVVDRGKPIQPQSAVPASIPKNPGQLADAHSQSHSPIDYVARVFSMLSLIVAIAGVYYTWDTARAEKDQVQLALSEFNSQRLPIWIGIVDNKVPKITVKAADSAIVMNHANVYFAPQLDIGVFQILPPEHYLPLIVAKHSTQQAIKKLVPPKSGQASVALNAAIPIVVESSYSAKGEAFVDRSLYRLAFDFVVTDDKFKDPSIDFRGMYFIRRLKTDEDPKVVCEHIWNEELKYPAHGRSK